MRRNGIKVAIFVLLAGILTACGGGSGNEETKVAPTTTRTSAIATSAATTPTTIASTAVTSSPVSGPQTAAAILSKAMPYFPYELDNVRYGGTFRRAVQRMMPHFDPKLNNQTITENMRWTYEKLVGWVPNENDLLSHFEPLLADSWKASTDLKIYTFNLRKGIKWHNLPPLNGRELVADDVAFSINRYVEKESIYYSTYSQIESVEAPDKYTVVIRLKEPNAWTFNDLFPTGEYIVAPEVVSQGKGTIPLSLGIGTGPYIVKEYSFNVRGVFVRNPLYWQKDKRGQVLPYTDQIDLIFASDPGTLIAGMRTAQFDTTSVPGGLESTVSLIKSKPDLRVFRSGVSIPSSGFTFNTKKAPWNDARVRRAFSMALNKERLAEAVLTNPSNYEHGMTVPWNLVSDEPFTPDKLGPYYKYNPSESKKLRIEAGFPDGKIKIASPFTFSHPTMTLRSTTYQALFKDEGIEFELQPMDFSSYAPYYYQRQFKDVAISFQNGNDFTVNWIAQNKFQRDSTQNTALIDDPEIERIVKEIKVTTDPLKLRQYAKFLWDYDTLGVYYIWPPSERGVSVAQTRLRNLTIRTSDSFYGTPYLPWLADAPRTSP